MKKIIVYIVCSVVCVYLSVVLAIEYDKYKFVWSKNSWIEAAQGILWVAWPLGSMLMSFAPFLALPFIFQSNDQSTDR